MQKKLATVLFIGNDDKEPRSFQIPAYFLLRSKLVLTTVSLLVLFIISLSGYFCFSYISEKSKNNQLTEQIGDMQNDLKLVDSLQIKNKVNNIEDRLSQINDFLRERGVSIDSAAGGDDSDTLNLRIDPSVYEFYDNYTNSVFQDLKNIPVGFPYTGDVSSSYGNRRNPFGGRGGEFHSGIDLKGPTGDPIKATADGEVVNATWKGGYGICVVLDHGNGYQTYFGHLSGTNVMQGQKVKAGDVIGFLGSTGRSTGPHLHYEIRKDGVDINPLDYMYLN